jgi:hypothetical protein
VIGSACVEEITGEASAGKAPYMFQTVLEGLFESCPRVKGTLPTVKAKPCKFEYQVGRLRLYT